MESNDIPPQISDGDLLDLLHQQQIVSNTMGWKADAADPFNLGVSVSPNHPVVGSIPPNSGKLGYLAIKGGTVREEHTLKQMASQDYLVLDSSQLIPGAPSGNMYASFQPGQVPKVPNGNNDPFLFLLKLVGNDLPPTLPLVWRTPDEPRGNTLVLVDVKDGLYAGLITWSIGLIEIFGPIEQRVEFHWANLRRLHSI